MCEGVLFDNVSSLSVLLISFVTGYNNVGVILSFRSLFSVVLQPLQTSFAPLLSCYLVVIMPNEHDQNDTGIVDVWNYNLEKEMEVIAEVVEKYPYVAMVGFAAIDFAG